MNAPADIAELFREFDDIRELIAFARALRDLKVILPGGASVVVQFSPDGENAVIDLRTISASGQPPPTQLPAQTGHAGALLTTSGSVASWSP